jgi:hypothetical protein
MYCVRTTGHAPLILCLCLSHCKKRIISVQLAREKITHTKNATTNSLFTTNGDLETVGNIEL